MTALYVQRTAGSGESKNQTTRPIHACRVVLDDLSHENGLSNLNDSDFAQDRLVCRMLGELVFATHDLVTDFINHFFSTAPYHAGESVRAFDFEDWHIDAPPLIALGSFTAYANGYQDTASVALVFGKIGGDAGMSQVYYTIPVILKVTKRNGTHTNYAACYVVHETSPDVYGAPPFSPMGVDRGSAKVADMNASDASVLASACSGYPSGPMTAPAVGASLDISKNNFLDNRSGPIETISSFLNALNLKQYVRAYSYFQDPATYPGAYGPYAAGYANTGSITVTFGTVQNEGAAGSLYYKVPLTMHVLTTSSTTQDFVGCYTLRLGQPAVQATPPFQPMGIIAGKFQQVNTHADAITQLPTACN